MKASGVFCVVIGLVLFGLCLNEWNASQGHNFGRVVTDYRQSDTSDLASLIRGGDMNSTGSLVAKGLGGVIWFGIGVLLLKKAGAAEPKGRSGSRSMPRR